MKRFIIFCVSFLIAQSFVMTSNAQETSPAKIVETTVDKVRESVLTNKSKLSVAEMDKNLKDIIYPVFDFKEMAKRSLGANWSKGTSAQQEEFVNLFSELLAKNYLKKIRENVEKSKIVVKGEIKKGDNMLVRTVIIDSEGEESSIDYQMMTKDSKWLIYDVIIENIGLVSNYRSEFAGIIKKEEFNGLLVRLREKSRGNQ